MTDIINNVFLFNVLWNNFLHMEPLANRLRPDDFDSLVGQKHILEQQWFQNAIKQKEIPSLIFYGPPGIGKTTLATLIAKKIGLPFKIFSAVTSSIKDVKAFIEEAERLYRFNGQKTIVYVDELHRFNKAQQDAFLPWIEKGTIILLGTTTENPSFYVTAPLLSRTKVLHLNPLSPEDLLIILKRALQTPSVKDKAQCLSDNFLKIIADYAGTDARIALNALELILQNVTSETKPDDIIQILASNVPMYDKKGDRHYDLISAFIKSMRGSDPQAAIYYLARMLEAGEDVYFILRRMIIFASEDVGNADPHALLVATAAHHAFDVIGMPEGFIPLSHAATYLASAPKSNASYQAYLSAKEDVLKFGSLTPPFAILNPATSLLKQRGYGEGYKYPHDFKDGFVKNFIYLPEQLKNKVYYEPKNIGYEKMIRERLAKIKGGL